MIQIDKSDKLYNYLLNLGVDNIEDVYLELANNGRYNLNDVRQYFRQDFAPSNTQDIDDSELEKVLYYYIDLKHTKRLNSTQIKKLLEQYKQTNNQEIKDLIVNSQLKDVLYLCLNYTTLHKQIDVQDLVQVANLGLLEAINKYIPEAKIDFKDYLIYYVRKSVKVYEEKNNG